jgi:hypothetical protein
MADDRRRKTPLGVRVPSERELREMTPRGMNVIERGGGGGGARHDNRIPAEHVRAAIGRRREDTLNPFNQEEDMTPVTMILAVRSELKSDIEDIKAEIAPLKTLPSAVAQLTGEVSTTNRLLPQMLETIRDELKARRADDHVVVTTKTEVEGHRAITNINTDAADKAAKRTIKLQIAGLLTSASLLTALVTLLVTRC